MIEDFDIIFLNKQPEFIEQTENPFIKFIQNTCYSKVYQTKLVSHENDYLSLLENKSFPQSYGEQKENY